MKFLKTITRKAQSATKSDPKFKTIHIVRHGKALQDYHFIHDYDRPLIEKGIINNEAAAKQLHVQFAAPDRIISSHAARALHTAHIFARVMGYPHDSIQVNEKLYSDGEKEIHRILENLPDEMESVMVVGHNPDVTHVASSCAGLQGIGSIPTSGVVTIRFETDQWSQIREAKKKLFKVST